jgi:D-amino peptidase
MIVLWKNRRDRKTYSKGGSMKLMVLTDIEGVTGITTYTQAENTDFGQKMLQNDLFALLNGILSQGKHEIIVYDEHTDGRNIVIDNLPEQVRVICGKPIVGEYWKGIDSTYDGLIMLGLHARSGVAGALLPHSYSRKNLNIWINNYLVGEIGIEAAMAGDNNVPLLLITGDSAGVKEAEELVPGVRTVVVKEALGEFEALCYPPKMTYKLIYNTASEVVADVPMVKPLKFNGPIELKIEMAQSDYLENLKKHYQELFIEKNFISIMANTVTEAWMNYLIIQKKVKNI